MDQIREKLNAILSEYHIENGSPHFQGEIVEKILASLSDEGYEPTRWWRAIGEDGELWSESSDEEDVRRRARPTDIVQNLMRRVERRWETVPR